MSRTSRIIITSIFILPMVVYGLEFNLSASTFAGIITYVLSILNLLIPILVALALIFFFWGLSRFVISAGNESELKKGKNYMMWGILALFILFSYSAIISIFAKDLEIGDTSSYPFLPEGDGSSNSQKPGFPSLK